MADSIKFSLLGVNEIVGRFKEVKDDVKFKGGRFALRKSANVIKKAAIAGALKIDDPYTAEKIAKNIAIRWGSRRFKTTGDLSFRVGVLGGARNPGAGKRRRGQHTLEELGELPGEGKGNPGGSTWYWRLVEFGTSKTRAKPFMRPALQNNIGAATNEFLSQYRKALDRAIARARKG